MAANVFTNIATHMMLFATDTWGIISALIAHDFYKFGKDLGELIFMLIN
jgi:hypothetical protein